MRNIILLLFCFSSLLLPAQVDSIMLKGVTLISSDKLGNCYAVMQTEVVKINPEGRIIFNFSRKDYGNILQIDTRDPLRIHLFYRDFGMIRILDNQLGETSVIDLRKAGLTDPAVIANAPDGGIWVYERVNNQLLRFDDRLQQQLAVVDMFQLARKPLDPVSLIAADNRMALLTKDELYLFDRYGSYIRTIPLDTASTLLKVDDEALWYNDSDSLIRLDFRMNMTTKYPLPFPGRFAQLCITPQNYWVLLPSGHLRKIPVVN
jgi:hypothetical protein